MITLIVSFGFEGLAIEEYYSIGGDAHRSYIKFSIQFISKTKNKNPVYVKMKLAQDDVGLCKCLASSKKGNSLAHKLASIAFSSVQERFCLILCAGAFLVGYQLFSVFLGCVMFILLYQKRKEKCTTEYSQRQEIKDNVVITLMGIVSFPEQSRKCKMANNVFIF